MVDCVETGRHFYTIDLTDLIDLMPKPTDSQGQLYGWKARITDDGFVKRDLIRIFVEKYELSSVFVVAERADVDVRHDHYHFYFRKIVTQDTIRKWMKAHFDVTGNEYETGVCNEEYEGYLRYLCKGAGPEIPPDVVYDSCYNSMVDPAGMDAVLKLQKAFYDHGVELRNKRKRQELQATYTERWKTAALSKLEKGASLDDVIAAVLDAEIELGPRGLSFVRERVVDMVYCAVNAMSWRNQLADKLRRKFV